MKSFIRAACGSAVLFGAFTGMAHAQDLYQVNYGYVDSAETARKTVGFTKFEDLADLAEGNEGFDGFDYRVKPVLTYFDFRGATGTFIFDETQPGVGTLDVDFPGLGLGDLSFTGVDVDDAADKFLDYVKANGFSFESRLGQYAAGNTAVDPIAGNPASLLSQMVSFDGDTATNMGGFGDDDGTADGSSASILPPMTSFSPSIGRFDTGMHDVTRVTVPIDTIRPLTSGGIALGVSGVFAYTDAAGSKSYLVNGGVSLKVPVVKGRQVNWSVIPSVRIGGALSPDMSSAAILTSTAVSSVLSWRKNSFKATWTASVAAIRSKAIEVDDFKLDYDIDVNSFRNGFRFENDLPMNMFGRKATIEVDLVSNKLDGENLYIKTYNEYSVSIGTRRILKGLQTNSVRFGLTLIDGEKDYKGALLNFGYNF